MKIDDRGGEQLSRRDIRPAKSKDAGGLDEEFGGGAEEVAAGFGIGGNGGRDGKKQASRATGWR